MQFGSNICAQSYYVAGVVGYLRPIQYYMQAVGILVVQKFITTYRNLITLKDYMKIDVGIILVGITALFLSVTIFSCSLPLADSDDIELEKADISDQAATAVPTIKIDDAAAGTDGCIPGFPQMSLKSEQELIKDSTMVCSMARTSTSI